MRNSVSSDYHDLAQRNIALTAGIHTRTNREQVRGWLLNTIAALPIPPARSDGETILLIRPDHLGDVLLTTPAIHALAKARPDARLVALVGPWSAGIISAYPAIDLTLTLPFPGFARHPNRSTTRAYLMAWQWAHRLRKLRADSAIILRPDHWWGAMVAKLAGIPNRIGFDLPDVAPFLTQRLPFDHEHAVLHSMALVNPWTGDIPPADVRLDFPVQEDDRQYVDHLLVDNGFPDYAPRVIIHPGSGTAIKQWAAEKWAAVADELAAAWGTPVIFTGGDHEISLVHHIAGLMRAASINLAGETNIFQLAALYQGARIVLGPDSGPLHVATAVGTPTVQLFGPADPVEFGPWGDPARHAILTTDIACRPCRIIDWPDADPADHPCVRDIPVEAVVTAARRVADD
jgi:lipopolysaccharide heptosyltransferase II